MTTKAKKPRLPATFEEFERSGFVNQELVQWLQLHDKRLWGARVKPKDARLEWDEFIGNGVATIQKMFMYHAKLACKWWQAFDSEGAFRQSTAKAVNVNRDEPGAFVADEFDKLRTVIRRELADPKSPINEIGVTMPFATRYMASKGVKCNEMLLRGLPDSLARMIDAAIARGC